MDQIDNMLIPRMSLPQSRTQQAAAIRTGKPKENNVYHQLSDQCKSFLGALFDLNPLSRPNASRLCLILGLIRYVKLKLFVQIKRDAEAGRSRRKQRVTVGRSWP